MCAIQDTREQKPLDLQPLTAIRRCLKTGDYSLENHEDKVAIERKELSDLIACCGHGRERFKRELERLRSYEYRAIVVEGEWSQIEMKLYRGQMHPNALLGSILSFTFSAQVPIMMVGNHQRAGRMVSRMLFLAAKRLNSELRSDSDTESLPG